MRVLHVTHQYAPAIGGSERYITDLSEELVRRGHQIDVYTSRATDYHTWKSVLPRRAVINGVNIRRFNALPRRGHTWRALDIGLGNYWHSRSLLYEPFIFYGNGPIMPGLFAAIAANAHQYDLMHINQLHYAHAATAYAAARLRGLPVVTTPHLHAEQRETYDVGYLLDVLAGSQIIFADTVGEHDFLLSKGFPPMQVVIGGGSLNMKLFPPQDTAAARASLGIPTDAFVVLFLGRKTAYKGLEPSVRAFLELCKSHPHAYFVAMGPESESSLKLWREIGNLPNVLVRARVEDDERLAALAACDVLLLPSSGEAFGIVYLEAWAYHKPVIGAPIQAVKALISDGMDGWLIEPQQVGEIAGRLRWLADNPEAARAAGEAGHAKLLRRYTTESVADVVEGAYVRAQRRHRSQQSDESKRT
jgi:glycosyltransferase involved in cell wall biosynthesis